MPHSNPKEIAKRFRHLESERGVWEQHWQDIADLALTSREITTKTHPGTRRTRRQFDSTAPKALNKLAAGIHGLLTNPSTKWFALGTDDEDLNRSERVRLWLDDVVNRMLRLMATTTFGFNTHIHEAYLDLGGFGTAALIAHEIPGRIRFQSRPLAEIFLEGDEDCNVIAVFRKFELTAMNAKRKWPNGTFSSRIENADKTNADRRFTFVHAVFPRGERDFQREDGLNKPFASVYIELDNPSLVAEGGFDTFPYLTPRWSKASGEVYGRSPTMDVLSDIGMINAIRRTNIVGAEKAVDPPVVVDANAIEGPIRTAPGSIIYRRSGARNTIEPLITGSNVPLGEQILDKERRGIESGLFLDLFTLPELDRMTTAEVMERIQQRAVFLSPMLARLASELLGPLVTMVFKSMLRQRMFLPMPEELDGADLQIDYVSVLALAQRASESNGTIQWLGGLNTLAAAAPDVMDHVDTDELARYSATKWFNVPQRLLRPMRQVEALRQQRAQQLAAQQQAVAAQQAAATASDAGSAVKDVAIAGRT